jgi:hypothetical protein
MRKCDMATAVGTGYAQPRDGTLTCIVTRFRVKSVLVLPAFVWRFRTIRKEALATVPGLIKAELMFKSPKSLYTLSIWSSDADIERFNKLVSHVMSANWCLPRLARCAR